MVAMIDDIVLVVGLLRATIRARADLVAENLLLRQQLAVPTRPTRKRERLRAHDRLFWLVARMVRRDWRPILRPTDQAPRPRLRTAARG